MIDVIKQTPKIYSEMSRDYQVISRLHSALYNVCKMYIDNNDENQKFLKLISRIISSYFDYS